MVAKHERPSTAGSLDGSGVGRVPTVPDTLVPMSADDPDALRSELDRLRGLVGPDERSYEQLRIDLLGARDAARGAEAALGNAEGRIVELEAEVARLRRDHEWLRHEVVGRARRIRSLGRAAVARLRF